MRRSPARLRLHHERRAGPRGRVQDRAGIDPSGCGGVHSTICRTPATTAGTTVMHDGRRVHGPSAGHVAAHGGERPDDLAEPDPVTFVPPFGRQLPAVEVVQPRDQRVERASKFCRCVGLGPLELLVPLTMPASRGRRRRTVGRARSGRGRPSRTRWRIPRTVSVTVGSLSNLEARAAPPARAGRGARALRTPRGPREVRALAAEGACRSGRGPVANEQDPAAHADRERGRDQHAEGQQERRSVDP